MYCTEWPELKLVAPPGPIRHSQLTSFHSDDYIRAFERADAAYTAQLKQEAALEEAEEKAAAAKEKHPTARSDALELASIIESASTTDAVPHSSCCGGGGGGGGGDASAGAGTGSDALPRDVKLLETSTATAAPSTPPASAPAQVNSNGGGSASADPNKIRRRNNNKRKVEHSTALTAAPGSAVVVTGEKKSKITAPAATGTGTGITAAAAASTSVDLDLATLKRYGLVDDCLLYRGVFADVSWVSGASVAAADLLISRQSDVVINWCGGRHHAAAENASGYCYFNDIVLCIMKLLAAPTAAPAPAPAPAAAQPTKSAPTRDPFAPLIRESPTSAAVTQTPSAAAAAVVSSPPNRSFRRVLYIDIDIHHGDGVQNAFYWSDRCFTVSFHCRRRGFFPGTGATTEIGEGKGRFRCLNLPFGDGVTDSEFVSTFVAVIDLVMHAYRPDAIVLQCGVDALNTDPVSSFNATTRGLGACVEYIASICRSGYTTVTDKTFAPDPIPLVVLGGGGYHPPSVARAWMHFTSILCGHPLPIASAASTNDAAAAASVPAASAVAAPVPVIPIPEHDQSIHYRPSYALHTESISTRPNLNTPASLNSLISHAQDVCRSLLASSEWGRNRTE